MLAFALLLSVTPAPAQQPGRLATTAAALRTAPVFFHGRVIAVLGSVNEGRGFVRLESLKTGDTAPTGGTGQPIYVFWRERPTRSSGEIRGEFWDLGRLTEGDSRFSAYDFHPLLEAANQGHWPTRDQIFVILGASLIEDALPEVPTLRAIALAPERYENRSVTVAGRFRGRNLYGDLAGPLPTPTKWDFVIQAADAAVWISGLRPRGRGFELDPSARVDTARWVQVSGTLRREGSRSWIDAKEIDLATAPTEAPVEVVVPITPAEPPPTVVFSTPVTDEPDVDPTVVVRIQFSRDMDSRSFNNRVRISYQVPPQAPTPAPAPPTFTLSYNVGNRGLELKFGKPLERFMTVKLELLEGIRTIDGDPLKPWSMTFTTGR
jgi:hypothetical protein